MSNAKKANPELTLDFGEVLDKDGKLLLPVRPRKACFNTRAINIIEQWLEDETKGLITQIWKGFNWKKLSTRDATRILWGCLQQDAEDHDEVLTFATVERALGIGSVIESLGDILALVEDIIDRAMPVIDSEEFNQAVESLQKKTLLLKTDQAKPTGSDSSPQQ